MMSSLFSGMRYYCQRTALYREVLPVIALRGYLHFQAARGALRHLLLVVLLIRWAEACRNVLAKSQVASVIARCNLCRLSDRT